MSEKSETTKDGRKLRKRDEILRKGKHDGRKDGSEDLSLKMET
jgi:hypothetical protein